MTQPGEKVVLVALPPGFLDDLPTEDRAAVAEAVGKPILLLGFEDDGRAELELTDGDGVVHYVYVDPSYVGPIKA